MNIEKISVDGHYVWVDKDAEIKDDDWCHLGETSLFNGGIGRVNKNVIADNGKDGLIFRKIIAASPELKLTDVPTYVEWLAEQEYPKSNKKGYPLYMPTTVDLIMSRDAFINGYKAAEKELLDVDDMKELIVSQQLTIQSLQKRVDDLQNSYDKRQEWLTKAKREAGVEDRKSFDDVWKEMLNRPTWDDVRKAIELAQKEEWDEGGYLGLCYEPEKIIEQLKSQKTK